MYAELVKRLREDAPTALENCDFDFVETWIAEAADAIEDLSRAQEQWFEQERNALRTNADRIRAMNDTQLARFLQDMTDNRSCGPDCLVGKLCDRHKGCRAAWKAWLKKEAKP